MLEQFLDFLPSLPRLILTHFNHFIPVEVFSVDITPSKNPTENTPIQIFSVDIAGYRNVNRKNLYKAAGGIIAVVSHAPVEFIEKSYAARGEG